MNSRGYLQTGQTTCHDILGRRISCSGTGQDGEFRKGLPWPKPRFEPKGKIITDCLTGLDWSQNANLAEFPLTWSEALNFIADMNRQNTFGFFDWRLPNRRELRSLLSYQTRKPALPEGHPFNNVFHGWYWTSTTAAIQTAYAWYVHTEGARMFYGGKKQVFLLWPVRGGGFGLLPATGQRHCFDQNGLVVPCIGTGQDGEFSFGRPWPQPRFLTVGESVIDRLTNLAWLRTADLTKEPVTWDQAIKSIERLNQDQKENRWRLPNINELESLVDASRHNPALPFGHPFLDVRQEYWSSTTSMFEPDWAWALYLQKGALGVGQKKGPYFFVWGVRDYTEGDGKS